MKIGLVTPYIFPLPGGFPFGPSWQEFYPSFGASVLLVGADAEGFGTLSFSIPASAAGLAMTIQAGDLATLTVSAPGFAAW